MSLYSYLLDGMINELQRPTIFDQHFALGIPADETSLLPLQAGSLLPLPLQAGSLLPLRTGYYRPYHRYLEPKDSGVSNLVTSKDGFKVNLDVQQFKPEELNVKVVDDFVVVEGKHEERSDEHGFISRQFTRRYKLPKDIDAKALESKLSSDGVLQLHAPKLARENTTERSIPITHTNQPALKQKSATDTQAKKEDKKLKDDKK